MGKSKVYFADMRVGGSDNLLKKLKRLMVAAGSDTIDFKNKFAAIKIHFGEPGNLSYLRPNYSKVLVDAVAERGGKAFLERQQHAVCRRPQERARPPQRRLSKRLQPVCDRVPCADRRRPLGHGRGAHPCQKRRICQGG